MKIRNLQSLLVCFLEESSPLKMTEFLADGPDWHLFHFSPLWMNGAVPRSMNSIDAILEDKAPMITHLDLQKRFPIYHVCPKCLAALLYGSAFQ